nr:uncharacterized protein LOC124494839 [Dermatophagoides farinae]
MPNLSFISIPVTTTTTFVIFLFVVVVIAELLIANEIQTAAITTTTTTTTTNETFLNDKRRDLTCESLNQFKGDSGDPLNILAIGILDTNLLLITKDFFVYDLSIEDFDMTNNVLFIRYMPITMKEKYPKIYERKLFVEKVFDTGKIYNAIIMRDTYSDWLCFIDWEPITPYYGLNYDIKHSKIYNGWLLGKEKYRETMISKTSKPCEFYAFTNIDFGNQYGQMYGVLCIAKINCVEIIFGINNDRRHFADLNYEYYYHSLCFGDQNQNSVTIVDVNYICANELIIKWKILKGFVMANKFYLFTNHNIYIFSEDVVKYRGTKDNRVGKSFPLTKVKYKDFFKCGAFVPPNVISDSFHYWLIASSIMLLLMILVIILWWISTTRCGRHIHHHLYHHQGLTRGKTITAIPPTTTSSSSTNNNNKNNKRVSSLNLKQQEKQQPSIDNNRSRSKISQATNLVTRMNSIIENNNNNNNNNNSHLSIIDLVRKYRKPLIWLLE